MTRLTLLAATTLAAALAGTAAAQPVSGLYIGGGGGANFMQAQTSTFVTRGLVNGLRVTQSGPVRRDFDTGVVGVGSIGYGFGNGLRVEVEGDYRYNRLNAPNGTATSSFGGSEKKYGGMVNALFDLDIGSPYVFPYFGAGVGYQRREYRSASTLALLGVRSTSSAEDGNFAYQGIGGVAFPIPYVPGLSLTAEYRFLGLAGRRSDNDFTSESVQPFTLTGRDRVKQDYNHSLMIGLRYAFDTAPPPVEAAAPAPASSLVSRTYLVFFDWDRADLTDRARAIIAVAARASTTTGTTRIEVDGNADRSGTPRYNIGLSQRRAQSVAAELVRDGVSRNVITIQAFGDTRPLVPTAAGVREPQNRRVEIILR